MYHENRCHKGNINSRWERRNSRLNRHHHKFAQRAEQFFNHKFRQVPANIEETDEAFILHLFAPALVKDHLKVITRNDVLTISYQPGENPDFAQKFTRREYSNGAFERSFALNGKVLNEEITARYADGILMISLPKNPETNTPAKDVTVN